jgi:cyclomaltodextrinase
MTQAETRHVTLDGGDAEVWAWEYRVTGTCDCVDDRGSLSVKLNGREVRVDREGDRFWAEVSLQPGENMVVARCGNGTTEECCSASLTLSGRLRPGPRARIAVLRSDEGVVLDGSESEPGAPESSPIVGFRWSQREGNPEPVEATVLAAAEGGARLVVSPPRREGEYYLSLTVEDAHGRTDVATAYFAVSGGSVRLPDLDREAPAWVEEAVVYGVVPHNTGPEGFRSVTRKLADLRELGITAIWLSPCTATEGGHGYAVDDYFTLRLDYGTEADFRELIQAAHAQGIRVLMDFVPNHTSCRHRYFVDAQARGAASPYYDFYDRDPESGEYTYYFDWVRLPNLNYDNPQVRRWMLEAFSYWVREFDVDGFRVDVAWGVKLRRPEFWPEWRREMKRIKPDLMLLAEASARDPYWFTDGFDAAYDWTEELGCWAWTGVFDDPDRIASRLEAALTNDGRGYHADALIFRFLNNNDTGARFLTRYGLPMERVAAAMVLTLPGVPCIYTGQETGTEFEPYRTAGPIVSDDHHGVRPYYARLIELRRATPALHSRAWQILTTRSKGQVLAYARFDPEGGPPALVVLNFSPEEVEADLTLNGEAREWAEVGAWDDLLGGERVTREAGEARRLRVRLAPSSARILTPDRSG